MASPDRPLLTSSHWGSYEVEVEDGRVVGLNDFAHDADPSPIGHGIVDVLDGDTRVTSPMIRKSWLEGGPGTAGERRGVDDYVSVSWEKANELVAVELNRVRREHGNEAIFGGSYGWASAGRFHHAQSQLKRFLNCIGGFTSSKNTYSFAAAEVVVPHVLGAFREHLFASTGWESIAESTDLVVAFGGIPLKNGQISQGGLGNHVQRAGMAAAIDAGVDFVNISPMRSDVDAAGDAQWLSIRPSTDAALMIGLAFVLLDEGLHHEAFLDSHTVGFSSFASYLRGETDGVPKTAAWASAITEIPEEAIVDLARRMAGGTTMISVAYALTRQDHGEQPFWAAIALASMLGQIGQPGGGIGFGYSAMNYIGLDRRPIDFANLPQGDNPVDAFIPVARVTEMLESPGAQFDYDGASYAYPDIRLVWWAGGNPFHHHQDLNRLRNAWAKPETVIVNEWCWNALAKHADIVLPCTTTLERSDITLNPRDPFQIVMDKAVEPVGLARDDHDIFRGIAAVLGVEEDFTQGRTPDEWQRWLYEKSRQSARRVDVDMPEWEQFQAEGWFRAPDPDRPTVMLEAFGADAEANPLPTPSGKIEIASETIASFGYDDCPGHPVWLEPAEWLGNATPSAPLHLISNQPKYKLHSQLDHGSVSQAGRPGGREPLLMHPDDASARGLAGGDSVRIHNARGACLAGLIVSDEVRPGVVQMSTGAWFDPDDSGTADSGEMVGTCRNGNPNAVTLDKGTSRLAQGPIAHSCLVEVERDGTERATNAYVPPTIAP